MIRWEYRWTTVYPATKTGTSLEMLNRLGEEGWEAVALAPGQGKTQAVLLKRPRPDGVPGLAMPPTDD